MGETGVGTQARRGSCHPEVRDEGNTKVKGNLTPTKCVPANSHLPQARGIFLHFPSHQVHRELKKTIWEFESRGCRWQPNHFRQMLAPE